MLRLLFLLTFTAPLNNNDSGSGNYGDEVIEASIDELNYYLTDDLFNYHLECDKVNGLDLMICDCKSKPLIFDEFIGTNIIFECVNTDKIIRACICSDAGNEYNSDDQYSDF